MKNSTKDKVLTIATFILRKISLLAVLQLIVAFIYKHFSLKPDSYEFITPLGMLVIIELGYLFSKRNNPHYRSYYFFHLSKTSEILLAIGTSLIFIFAAYSLLTASH